MLNNICYLYKIIHDIYYLHKLSYINIIEYAIIPKIRYYDTNILICTAHQISRKNVHGIVSRTLLLLFYIPARIFFFLVDVIIKVDFK